VTEGDGVSDGVGVGVSDGLGVSEGDSVGVGGVSRRVASLRNSVTAFAIC
jgi:hypothetical protein